MKIWIFDCNPNARGNALEARFKELGVRVEFHPQVWDENKHELIPVWEDCKNDFQLNPGDVICIHAQDTQQMYWKLFVKHWKKDRWIIIYSGGGLEKSKFEYELQADVRLCVFEPPVPDDGNANWQLKKFIESVRAGDVDPCNKLTGFNPQLEAMLRLLHLCLTPAGLKSAQTLINKEFGITLKKSQEGQAVNGLDTPAEQLVVTNALSEMIEVMKRETDCLSPTYIRELEKLRQAVNLQLKL